jgi:hypothetical protein
MFIKDMTDGHLRNAIFYLNKRCGELRGTAYQETPDMIWVEYDHLRREADKRKLSWMSEKEPERKQINNFCDWCGRKGCNWGCKT